MVNPKFIGLLKLSLAHHPVCWQYRNHTIKIFKIKFCLGCTGFYSGFFLGSLIIFLTPFFSSFSWTELVLLSTFLYIPTMLRLIKLPLFKSSDKRLRILFRFLLGFGISTGLLSIFIANNLLIQIIQVFMGLGFYTGITIMRVIDKNAFKECETCTFIRSRRCPGFKPFHPTVEDIPIIFSPSSND